jgi:hypothetical protein
MSKFAIFNEGLNNDLSRGVDNEISQTFTTITTTTTVLESRIQDLETQLSDVIRLLNLLLGVSLSPSQGETSFTEGNNTPAEY